MPLHHKATGSWTPVGCASIKSSGAWGACVKEWIKRDGIWTTQDTTPPDQPAPGTYILSPTSISIGSHTGYAEFNTAYYRGYISEVKVQITWRDAGGYTTSFDVSGRPSGNYYRQIQNNAGEWDGRTITHNVGSYDAAAITEFNSGAAIGFSFDAGSFNFDKMISYARLVLTVS